VESDTWNKGLPAGAKASVVLGGTEGAYRGSKAREGSLSRKDEVSEGEKIPK